MEFLQACWKVKSRGKTIDRLFSSRVTLFKVMASPACLLPNSSSRPTISRGKGRGRRSAAVASRDYNLKALKSTEIVNNSITNSETTSSPGEKPKRVLTEPLEGTNTQQGSEKRKRSNTNAQAPFASELLQIDCNMKDDSPATEKRLNKTPHIAAYPDKTIFSSKKKSYVIKISGDDISVTGPAGATPSTKAPKQRLAGKTISSFLRTSSSQSSSSKSNKDAIQTLLQSRTSQLTNGSKIELKVPNFQTTTAIDERSKGSHDRCESLESLFKKTSISDEDATKETAIAVPTNDEPSKSKIEKTTPALPPSSLTTKAGIVPHYEDNKTVGQVSLPFLSGPALAYTTELHSDNFSKVSCA